MLVLQARQRYVLASERDMQSSGGITVPAAVSATCDTAILAAGGHNLCAAAVSLLLLVLCVSDCAD
jgi:hypothetical protein